jgi:putative SOS response-associated peptidase YedK
MCGRFTLTADRERVADHFGMDPATVPDLPPRYNIAPTQPVPVVAFKPDGETFGLAMLRWGLVPRWSGGPEAKGEIKPTNARSDSLGKPMFWNLFARQRCLIPADGFYEWETVVEGKRARKIPVHFSLAGGGLLALAGLWEVWTDASGRRKVPSVCLITTDANEVVGRVHDRMPVVIPRVSFRRWVDNGTPERELKAMLRPYPAGEMTARVADPVLNKVGVEGPQCWGLASV